jgi:hypothetical protein
MAESVPEKDTSGKPTPQDVIDVSKWAKIGKTIVVVCMLGLLIYALSIPLRAKWIATYGTTPTAPKRNLATSYVPQVAAASSPVAIQRVAPALHTLKSGKSEKVYIRSKKIVFLPDSNGMLFRLYDKNNEPIKVPNSNGELVEETDLLSDWGSYRPHYLQFRTDTDKEWFIKDWY